MADSWGTATAEPATNGDAWGTVPAADGAEGDAWGSGGGETADADTADHGKKYEAVKLTKDEFLSKAREAGWTETTAFDYSEFQRTGGNDADYHGASKVYEWKDEFGDVGPEVPELERILFGGEFQMRKGEHTEHLDLEVNLEGPVQIPHIRKVSHPTHRSTLSLTMM